MDIEASKIKTNGQIVIPAKLRRRFGLKPGTKVLFIERNNEIFLQPVTREYVRSVHGMLAGEASVTEEILKDRAVDREHEEAMTDEG